MPRRYILTGQANRETLFQQSAVGQQFSHTPVQGQGTAGHFAAVIINLGNLTLYLNTVREYGNLGATSCRVLRSIPVLAGVRQS